MTRGTTKDDSDAVLRCGRSRYDVCTREADDGARDSLDVRKGVVVNGCVHGVHLDGSDDVETGLLEPKGHAPSACKQVYRNGAHRTFRHDCDAVVLAQTCLK